MPDYDRQQVEERLDARQRQIDERRRALREGGDGQSSELADYDQHPGDQGTETYMKELDETTEVILEEDERRIRQAREQLERGTYGTCVDCGEPIPAERLEAVPETIRCVKDQRIFEARMRGPGGAPAAY